MKWVALESAGDVPKARSSHSITAVGHTLYLWGGEHAPRVPIGTDLHAYDMNTRAWSKLEVSGTPPSLRNAHAAAAVGPHIYFFGGRSGIDIGEGCLKDLHRFDITIPVPRRPALPAPPRLQGSLNDLHRFDTTTSNWAEVELAPGSPLPCKRSYHAMAATGGKLYLFGGCGEGCVGRLADLWEFDPAAASWRQLPSSDAIKGRGGAGFAATPDALFVVCGFTGQEMNDVHRFDLRTETWDCPRCCSGGDAQQQQQGPAAGAASACSHSQAPVQIPARSVCAVAAHGCTSCAHSNHIIVFGGEVDPSTLGHAGAGSYSNDTFCLDTACQHWHRITPAGEPPQPRGWLAATACPVGVVVHGGNDVNNERLSDMFLLEMH